MRTYQEELDQLAKVIKWVRTTETAMQKAGGMVNSWQTWPVSLIHTMISNDIYLVHQPAKE
jgi:hypothetical protein